MKFRLTANEFPFGVTRAVATSDCGTTTLAAWGGCYMQAIWRIKEKVRAHVHVRNDADAETSGGDG